MDDVDHLLRGIKKGLTHKIDVGKVETQPDGKMYYFLGSLGIGLGTTVNKFVENWKEKGIMITKIKPAMEISGFIKGVRGSFSENKVPIKVIIEWENRKIERDVTLLVFQNTPLYSRNLKLSPDASPYDKLSYEELSTIINRNEQTPGNYALFDKLGMDVVRRSKIKLVFLNGYHPEYVKEFLEGKNLGTIVQ